MNQISSLLKFLGNQLKNTSTPVCKSWADQTVPASTYKVMTTFNIPAGVKAIIIGKTGNGVGEKRNNTCNFNLESGTTNKRYNGTGSNDSGSGNFAVGWYYIEASTNCIVQVRQYGYEGAISSAMGEVVCIPLLGGALRNLFKAFKLQPFESYKGGVLRSSIFKAYSQFQQNGGGVSECIKQPAKIHWKQIATRNRSTVFWVGACKKLCGCKCKLFKNISINTKSVLDASFVLHVTRIGKCNYINSRTNGDRLYGAMFQFRFDSKVAGRKLACNNVIIERRCAA